MHVTRHCIVAVLLLAAGCSDPASNLPVGAAALPAAGPVADVSAPIGDYLIGPLDVLRINVFGEPDLSGEQPVGLNGNVDFPLIGTVPAQGRTTDALAADITQRLNARYLRRASVSVAVLRSQNYTFTVEGEVKKPGIYPIPGRATLVQAVALGEGATEYAKLDEVVVFRTVAGQRYAARFNLAAIRAGREPDLQLRQGDVVVVGYSAATRRYRELLNALPGIAGLFVALR